MKIRGAILKFFKNTSGLGMYLSVRVLAYHAQGPEFDPQYAEKKKKLQKYTVISSFHLKSNHYFYGLQESEI